MTDSVVESPQTEVHPSQDDFKAGLDQQMAISLNGGIPPAETITVEPKPTVVPTTEPTPAAPAPSDSFSLFKEKFGYETPEAALQEIEQLRAFKAAPRTPEFEFDNEESATILKALAAGKRDEIYRYLDSEFRIDRLLAADVTKDTAADIVKMGMQLKYKDLTPDEINYKFNKQFAIPPEPQKSFEEDDEIYDQRISEWKAQVADKQMEMMIEAKLAKPELQTAKGKLVLPNIENQVDEGYIQYQKMLEESSRLDEETKKAYKTFTPKAIETKLNFKDEANKIDFDFQHEPDAEGFGKAVEIASNAELFWKLFTKPDGTPDREGFLDAIYYRMNKNKILLSALSQAKNAAIKANLPDNTEGGLVRQMPQDQGQPNELDQMMRISLRGHGGF